MGFTLTAQAQGFASSLLLGFSLALAYDLLRAVRLKRRGLAFLTPLCDTLYCALFALLVFLFSLRVGGGELRLYMIVSALLGALFYFSVCARRDGFMVNLPNFAKDTFFFPKNGL